MNTSTSKKNIPRSPVVVVMGHIDHGKSTLLDYIRKTNIVAGEAGGITQHMAAYEVEHKNTEGKISRITFIDTPGHEAFVDLRSRGAHIADVAILVVSAEDGVKPQTMDALKSILTSNIPYVVAINKIDKPNANIEKTKQSLAEHDILIEEWGGKIPVVPISAKTGTGLDELLDMVLLTAEMEEFSGDPAQDAEGLVLEANVHKTKGITATLVIKNGTLKVGSYVVSGEAYSPVRNIENFKGEKVTSATFSSPVKIVGWTVLPKVGSGFVSCETKKEAEFLSEKNRLAKKPDAMREEIVGAVYLPIIIKADASGTLDAISHEIKKLENEKIRARIIHRGVGDINENDIKASLGKSGTVIVGFSVKTDAQAHALAEREGVEIKTFNIIYELADYLKALFTTRTPKVDTEEVTGELKVLKFFSTMKNKHVIGGKVVKGKTHVKDEVKIMRRGEEIGRGTIAELQHLKTKVSELEEGKECGILLESKSEVAPGDILESYIIVQK